MASAGVAAAARSGAHSTGSSFHTLASSVATARARTALMSESYTPTYYYRCWTSARWWQVRIRPNILNRQHPVCGATSQRTQGPSA